MDIEISHSESGDRGRYEARIEGHAEAGELDWYRRGDGARVAHHTEVPKSLRGRGIAGALVDRLVEDARKDGFRIVPKCPFVRSRFDDAGERWADVLAEPAAAD